MDFIFRMFIAVFCIGLPSVLGHEVVLAMSPRISAVWRYGLSFGVGAGLITFWIFILGILKVPLTVTVINLPILALSAVLFIFRRLRNATVKVSRKTVRFRLNMLDFRVWVAAAVFLNVLFVFIEAGALQTYAWDSLSYIAFNAKVIFFEQSFQYNANLPHPSSPMGIPLLQFWFNLNLGYWSEYFIQTPFPMYFISLLWVVWSFLKKHVSDRAAWIGLFLLVSANLPVCHATVGYMDLPLCVYLCSAVLLVFEAVKNRDERLFLIAGLCAALGAWTKLEGTVFVLFIGILYVFFEWRVRRVKPQVAQQILKRLAVLGIFPLIVFAVQWVYKRDLGLLLFASRFVLLGFEEVFVRLRLFWLKALKSMFFSFNWSMNWFIWLAVLTLTPFYKNRISAYLCAGIVMFWVAWLGCFVFTNNFQYLDAVLSRAFLQFFPLVVIMNAVCLDEFVFSQMRVKDGSNR